MTFHPLNILCEKCEANVPATEIFVSADGTLLLQGDCSCGRSLQATFTYDDVMSQCCALEGWREPKSVN